MKQVLQYGFIILSILFLIVSTWSGLYFRKQNSYSPRVVNLRIQQKLFAQGQLIQ